MLERSSLISSSSWEESTTSERPVPERSPPETRPASRKIFRWLLTVGWETPSARASEPTVASDSAGQPDEQCQPGRVGDGFQPPGELSVRLLIDCIVASGAHARR